MSICKEIIDRFTNLDRVVSSPKFHTWKSLYQLGITPDQRALIPSWVDWNTKINEIKSRASQLSVELDDYNNQLSESKSKKDLYQQALDFHLESITQVMGLGTEVLAQALTSVYRKVFDRPDWSVVLEIEDFRGSKRLNLSVHSPTRGTHRLDELGGSSIFVLGVVIECYYLVYSGLARVIFFDESLSSLSQVHLERFLSCLRSFVDDLGFIFLIVDHAPTRFEGYVDTVFTTQPHPDGGSVWTKL